MSPSLLFANIEMPAKKTALRKTKPKAKKAQAKRAPMGRSRAAPKTKKPTPAEERHAKVMNQLVDIGTRIAESLKKPIAPMPARQLPSVTPWKGKQAACRVPETETTPKRLLISTYDPFDGKPQDEEYYDDDYEEEEEDRSETDEEQ